MYFKRKITNSNFSEGILTVAMLTVSRGLFVVLNVSVERRKVRIWLKTTPVYHNALACELCPSQYKDL